MEELRMAEAVIREDILQKFPDLFGTKNVNRREVNIERTITTLTQELGPEIAAALTGRRMLLESPAPVRENMLGRSGTRRSSSHQQPGIRRTLR
jgi:hypothetical protein